MGETSVLSIAGLPGAQIKFEAPLAGFLSDRLVGFRLTVGQFGIPDRNIGPFAESLSGGLRAARRRSTITDGDSWRECGNIWRGLSASHRGMERTTADYMGMLATVINGLALKTQLEALGLTARVHTAIRMDAVAEPFIRNRAVHQLSKGDVIVFVAGTGNPFFSTDTTAALRANEIGAEVIFKATKVDGIYTADPMKDPKAKRYERITFQEALSKRLNVMDSTAFSLCMDNKLPIVVFDMGMPRSIQRAVCGEPIGTVVSEST